MKLNLKSTIAAPAGNNSCQKALNGIIGNTRRGIVVDKTLDPDSNNPVANKPVSTALAALVGKIDAALQKPTGLTKTKLVGVGTNGQENIEIGENLTLANGKLSATGGSIPVVEGTESTITTDGAYATYTIPAAQTSCFIFKCDLGTAFISYNDVFGTYNGYLDAEGDVTDGSLKLNDLIVLSGSGTTIDIFFGNIGVGGGGGSSGLPIVQATLSGTIGEIKTYTIPEKQTSPFILSIDGNYVLTSVSASGDDYYGEYYSDYKYYYISGGDTTILLRENTSFVIGSKVIPLFTDYNILVDKQSSRTEILPCTASDNGKVLSVVNGEAQWANAGGGVTITFED